MYNVFKLDNGLRVVVEKIDYINSVSVGLWVENGSRNENKDNNGISHFIEHMLFKGTENRSAKDIAEAIENVGGQLNAFTGREATCYYIKALDSHLGLSLDVLSDMLFNSTFNEEEIEKEKSVVIEEINMGEDSPEDVLSDLHSYAIWGEDSLSYPILGTEETVKSFNKNIIKEYIATNYTPNRSVISICGNVDLNEAQNLVHKYFGKWNIQEEKIISYSNPEILKHILYKEKSIEQVHLSLGLKGLPLGHEDVYPLLLINNFFGGGVSSLLFQKVREELGLCYTIYSYSSSFINTGALNVYTGVSPNYVYDTISVIKEEIEKFPKEVMDKFNLAIAKEQIKGNYILGLESTSSRMFSNGKSIMFLNKINKPEDIIKKIDEVS
ncbi:M16 family metallopeptidase, partial [Clostridium sp.]|uniref:M16 family metallopeptidase n=1 Tax=Clostridium sp. TaxID=1506 RepID=UPI0034638CD2